MKVRELKGWPHVFTLTSGKTLRIFPYQEKDIPAEEVSEDITQAVNMKLISCVAEVPKAAPAVSKHTTKPSSKKVKNN